MSIVFNKADLSFIDERTGRDIFCGGRVSVAYTLKSDDVREFKRVSATPYESRVDEFIPSENGLFAKSTNTSLEVSPFLDGVRLDMRCFGEVSELGLNLPFNFIGKIGGGGYKMQYLFNSPVASKNKSILYFYLENPCGNDLVVASLSGSCGWKMDYSPYLWAHYFVNLKVFSAFDKIYNMGGGASNLSLVILPVCGFDDCLDKLSRAYALPFLSYDVSGGALGEKITLTPHSKIDELIIEDSNKSKTKIPFTNEIHLKSEGISYIYPVRNGKIGGEVSVFAYDNLISLYKKSILSVDLDIIKRHTDSNLCEHQCWASATLRFLKKYKHLLTDNEVLECEKRVLSLLDIITEENDSEATPRITVFKKPHDGFGAYNVYKSRRVQELFFGITILLDAYTYFGYEKYYEYLIGATDNLIDRYQGENGEIFIDWGSSVEDYSTVCAPIIPILDVANLIKGRDKCRYFKYMSSAKALAEHIYKRGLHFPTEGGETDLAEEEMEDGSISCSALSLLYYCKHGEMIDEYIRKAKEILSFHTPWVIKAPLCQLHCSSLRWWETQWEGDGDGPAICAGHAWSIWRGEADYLYYELTGDKAHLTLAKSTFITNLSKIQENGVSYANYNPDMINGGGFDKVEFKIAGDYPKTPDCGLSRYLWIRINDTFLQ